MGDFGDGAGDLRGAVSDTGILPEISWVAAPCCSIAADGGDFGTLADGRTDHLDRADRLVGSLK